MPRLSKRSKSRQSGQSSHDSDFHSFVEKQEYLRQNGDTQSNENRQHRCGLCLKPATQACERCGDCYCSRECQRRDWPDHRPICFRMPRLVPIGGELEDGKSSYNEIPKMASRALNNSCDAHDAQLENPAGISTVKANSSDQALAHKLPKHGSCVILITFRTPNRCYVRSSNPSDVEAYTLLLKKVEQYGKTAPQLKNARIDGYAIALRGQTFHRVQIVSRNENRYRVHFIDHGNMEYRTLKELLEINDEILNLPRYASCVQLHNVKRSVGLENFSKKFAPFDNKEFKIFYVREDMEIPLVNLHHWQSNKSLNEEIAKLISDGIKPKEVSGSSESNGCKEKDFRQEENAQIAENSNHIKRPYNAMKVRDDTTNTAIHALPADKVQNGNSDVEILKSETSDFAEEENAQIAENSNHIKRPYNAMKVKDDTTNTAIHALPADKVQNGNSDVEILKSATGDVVAVTKELKHDEKGNKKGDSLLSKGAVPKRAMPTIVSKQSDGRCMNPPFKVNKLSMDAKDFNVVVLDNGTINFGYVGCIPQAGLATLRELQTYLVKEYKDDGKSYEPKINEYCLAYYDTEWYRAKVIENHIEDEYTVYYIDFANELTVRSKDIRRYPKDLTIDCNTNLCLIAGLPSEMEDEQIEFLREQLHFYSVHKVDYVIEVDEDLVIIRCDDLLTKMKENDLL
uniref:MYND-type domain-containing protein n=1 Tax=Glossina morsitans morsitans TaxID=37546 RepID=A0A1B0FL72_GLOMM